ncbi:MAG: OmpH family outer membrane protein [Muribaculaceae bacterium]|nr:OmpH family outer membrane protein [Muribaculaceae bacterium]
MIKRILLAVALAIPMFVSAQTFKMGVVDTNAVMQSLTSDLKVVEDKMAATSKEYEDSYSKLQNEMKRLYDELNALPADAPTATKERKSREFTQAQTNAQKFVQDAQNDMDKLQQELMAPIMDKVRKAIEAVAKEGSFSLVQEVNAGILYEAAPVINITDQVKARLGVK